MTDPFILQRVKFILNQHAQGSAEVTDHSRLKQDLGLCGNKLIEACGDIEDEFQITPFTQEQLATIDTPRCIATWVLSKQAAQRENRTPPLRLNNASFRAFA